MPIAGVALFIYYKIEREDYETHESICFVVLVIGASACL